MGWTLPPTGQASQIFWLFVGVTSTYIWRLVGLLFSSLPLNKIVSYKYLTLLAWTTWCGYLTYVCTSLWHHHKLVILAHLWPFFTSLCLFLIAPSTGLSSINRHPFTLLLYSLCHCQTNPCHYFLPEETSSHLCTCYPFSLLPSRHHFCCLKLWIVWALHTDIHTRHIHTDTRLYVCVFVSETLIWSRRGSIAGARHYYAYSPFTNDNANIVIDCAMEWWSVKLSGSWKRWVLWEEMNDEQRPQVVVREDMNNWAKVTDVGSRICWVVVLEDKLWSEALSGDQRSWVVVEDTVDLDWITPFASMFRRCRFLGRVKVVAVQEECTVRGCEKTCMVTSGL